MNSEIMLYYEEDLPVALKASNITNLALHSHPGTIELIYLLKGEADVKVSFESFSLTAGDLLVVNHGDFHFIKGKGKDNAVLSLFFNLPWLQSRINHIRYITFACESFMIQDSRKEYLDMIRGLIHSIAFGLISEEEGYKDSSSEKALQMMSILVDHFTILQYYSNEQKLSAQKLEKYYNIMKILEERYQSKSLIDEIFKSEYYSKFYLAHLYKGMMLMSIQDSLSAMRCFQSEKLLLATDKSIQEIALECGFSDAKYYYKHFHKWYDCTPAEYRKQYRAELYKENITEEIPPDKLWALLGEAGLKTECGIAAQTAKPEKSELFYFAAVDLFGGCAPADAASGDTAAPNWDAVDKAVRNMREKGFVPYVEMHYDSRSADDWTGILKTCCSLYDREVGNWEFCFYYDAPDQEESLQNLIFGIQQAYPRIKIRAMLVWNRSKT